MPNLIKYGDSSFVIKSIMPSKWSQPTGVTITITRDTGIELVAATAATLYAGDTTATAISKLSKTATITTGTAVIDGQILAVGSDAYGWKEMVVESYDSSTKLITFKERFQEALPAGVYIKGRELSYTLDASGDDWDFTGDVSVVWTPAGISELPFTQLFTVLKRESASGGLESKFAVQFEDYYKHCIGSFDQFEKTARLMVTQKLKNMNRDLPKIIDSDEYDFLIMQRIAINIAAAHGGDFETRYAVLSAEYNDYMSVILSNQQWDDTNQDLIKDEDEVNRASRIGYMRNY